MACSNTWRWICSTKNSSFLTCSPPGTGIGGAASASARGVVAKVALDLVDQIRAGAEQAFVDEHQTAMPPVRLQARHRLGQHRIGRIEQPFGEIDRILVSDREALDVNGGLPGRPGPMWRAHGLQVPLVPGPGAWLVGVWRPVGRSLDIIVPCLREPHAQTSRLRRARCRTGRSCVKTWSGPMQYVNAFLCLLFVVCAIAQYNDPDALLWFLIYAIPAAWAGAIAWRPEPAIEPAGRRGFPRVPRRCRRWEYLHVAVAAEELDPRGGRARGPRSDHRDGGINPSRLDLVAQGQGPVANSRGAVTMPERAERPRHCYRLTALMPHPARASERIGTLPGSGRAPGAGCPRR